MVENKSPKKYLKKHQRAKKENIYLNIVYEDEKVIVCNKPSSLLTIKNEHTEKCLYHMVLTYLKMVDKHNSLFIVHRLDKDTSGLVIFAKDFKTKKILQDAFENKEVVRKYEAVVDGIIEGKNEVILKDYLFTDKFNNVFVSKKKTDILAITRFKVNRVDLSKNKSYLDITIETGKRNQIRCQLANYNHPILGDKKYLENPKGRLMLNAYKLEFPKLKGYLNQTLFEVDKLFLK